MRTLIASLFFLSLSSASYAGLVQCPKSLGYHEKTPLVLQAKEIMSSVYKQLGCNVEFSYLPTKRSLVHFNNGLVDGEFYRFPEVETQYTQPFVRSREPLLKVQLGIWGHPHYTHSNKPLGYVKGYPWQDDYVETNPNVKAIGYNNADELNKAYNLGHISAMLTNNLYANYLYRKKVVSIQPVPLEIIKEHLFYHYLDARFAAFMDKFSQTIAAQNPFLALNKSAP